MLNKFPFDPEIKHHVLIGIGLAFWVFAFLFLTEPLGVSDFTLRDKLRALPFYGLAGFMCYVLIIYAYQNIQFEKNDRKWFVKNELLFSVLFICLAFVFSWFVYRLAVMRGAPAMYNIFVFLRVLFLPAVLIMMPMVFAARWALGRYVEKKLEEQKIEIQGQGNFENLRVLFNNLVLIQSADNYVEISYLENNQLRRVVLRTTLSKLEQEHKSLMRVHRSYLINPFHFKQWKKQAGKLSVVLCQDIEAPVSKTFETAVKNGLNLATK